MFTVCLSVCLSFSLSLLFIWAVCACSDNVQSVTLDVTSLFILMQCLSPSISLKPRRSKGRNYCVADPLLPWSIAARLCEPEVCCLSCIYTSSVVCLLYRGLLSALLLHLFCCLPSLQRFAVCLDFTPFLLSAFLPEVCCLPSFTPLVLSAFFTEVCCLPCFDTSSVFCLLDRVLLSALPLHLFCCLPSLQKCVFCLPVRTPTTSVVCLLYWNILHFKTRQGHGIISRTRKRGNIFFFFFC